jgi:hypothetical protein
MTNPAITNQASIGAVVAFTLGGPTAPSLVQYRTFDFSNEASQAVSFTSNTGANNLLILTVFCYQPGAGLATVSGWTALGSQVFSTFSTLQGFYISPSAASAGPWTVNLSGLQPFTTGEIAIFEFTNVASTVVPDYFPYGDSAVASTSATASGGPPAGVNNLQFGMMYAPNATSINTPNGYAAIVGETGEQAFYFYGSTMSVQQVQTAALSWTGSSGYSWWFPAFKAAPTRTFTQTANARLAASNAITFTQPAAADIQNMATTATFSIARINRVTQISQSTVARIIGTGKSQFVQHALARINQPVTLFRQTAAFRIQVQPTSTQSSKARIASPVINDVNFTAVLGTPRWVADVGFPRWDALIQGPRWTATVPPPRWSATVPNTLGPIPTASQQYVPIVVAATKLGAAYNPTGDTVQIALTSTNREPAGGDWISAVWEVSGSQYTALALITPGQYSAGTYYPWVKVTDNPETPVIPAEGVVVFGP